MAGKSYSQRLSTRHYVAFTAERRSWFLMWQETVYTLSFDAGIIQNLAMTDTNAAFSIQFTTGQHVSCEVLLLCYPNLPSEP